MRCAQGGTGPDAELASWYVDETYLKVRGMWCYLYRAIDWFGNLIDAMLSDCRDMRAAKAFSDRLGRPWPSAPGQGADGWL
jgi:transposase-like protein